MALAGQQFMNHWCGILNGKNFEVYKYSRRYPASKKQRLLKVYVPCDYDNYLSEEARLVVSHLEIHKQEIVFLRDLKRLQLSSRDDRCLTIDYSESISEKGGFVLIFKSFAERQLFAHFVRLLNGRVIFGSDFEWNAATAAINERPSGTKAASKNPDDSFVVHNIETINSFGCRTDFVVILDYSERTVALGKSKSDVQVECHIDAATLIFPPGSSTRLDLSYFESIVNAAGDTSSSGAIGSNVLQKALNDKKVRMLSKKQRTVMFFKSSYSRERFAARFQAIKLSVVDKFGEGTNLAEESSLSYSAPTFKIFCGTFNVGDRPPPTVESSKEDMAQWIRPGEYDIYAIGLQECSHFQQWVKAISSMLGSNTAIKTCDKRLDAEHRAKRASAGGYVTLAKESLWSIHVVLVVRADLISRVSNVTTATEATGYGHILGNKGAAGVTLTFDNTTRLAFISSHLAAQARNDLKRTENYEEISGGMSQLQRAGGTDLLEWDHTCDHIFWLGDLNFRIDMGRPNTYEEFEQVLELTRRQNLTALLEGDTLAQLMAKRTVFVGYSEGAINFLPTYRMNKGASGYNNKKHQNPSYTDRILFKSAPGDTFNELLLSWYEASHAFNISDHRPIAAGFEIVPRSPFTIRDGLRRTGSIDDCLILFRQLTFILSPLPTQSLTSWQASFVNRVQTDSPMSFTVTPNGSFVSHAVSSTSPIRCENPESCTNAASFAGSSPEAVEKLIWGGQMPFWTSKETLLVRPTIPDETWLARQYLSIVVSTCGGARSGAFTSSSNTLPTEDILAQVDISLSNAFTLSRKSQPTTKDDYDRFSVSGDFLECNSSPVLGCSNRHPWSSVVLDEVKICDRLHSIYRPQPLNENSFDASPDGKSERGSSISENYDYDVGGIDGIGGGRNGGVFFAAPATLHGKWLGVMCGRIEAVSLEGISNNEPIDVTMLKLPQWYDLSERLKTEASDSGRKGQEAKAVTQQHVQSVKITKKALASTSTSASAFHVTSTITTIPSREVAADVASVTVFPANTDDAACCSVAVSETLVLNFCSSRQYKLNAERSTRVLQIRRDCVATNAEHENEGEAEDDDDEEIDDARKYPAWLEKGVVCIEDGRRLNIMPADGADGPFECCITKVPLTLTTDFVLHPRSPPGPQGEKFDVYSRIGFLKLFGDVVDRATLQPLRENDKVIAVLGNKVLSDNFRCVHSGAMLSETELMERDGHMYCSTSFIDVFERCPGCREPVTPDDPYRLEALGAVWHAPHFICVACQVEAHGNFAVDAPITPLLERTCFAHDAADGKGLQPYCERCYQSFCPTCAGCGEAINPALHDLIQGCGAFW